MTPDTEQQGTEVKEAFQSPDTPAAKEIKPEAADKKHDHLKDHLEQAEDRQEALIDEGLEESFPASDPLSPKHIS